MRPCTGSHSILWRPRVGVTLYDGSPSGYHDWAFRTRARILQHQAKVRREAAKEAKISSPAPSKAPSHKTGSLPASPSSAHGWAHRRGDRWHRRRSVGKKAIEPVTPDMDMADAVQKVLEGLRGDSSSRETSVSRDFAGTTA